MSNLEKAVKGMSIEALERLFFDAAKRAADGREIDNIPYAERQEEICRVASDEILKRKMEAFQNN